MSAAKSCYRPRRVRSTPLWQLMDRWWERFLSAYDEVLEPRYGYLRPCVRRGGEKYLKCGILDFGFARVRCPQCEEEYLLAYSCKCRICPSCMKKRQLSFGEFLSGEVLEKVSHRHVVFSLPRRLRVYFRNHRECLGGLSRCAYEAVTETMQHESGEAAAEWRRVKCAAVNVIHTCGS